MQNENQIFEKKCKRTLDDPKKIARECVALANSQGGKVFIGIADSESEPDINQKITQKQLEKLINRIRSLTFNVGLANFEIIQHENGGEYISFIVYPNMQSLATTSKGEVLIRVGSSSIPAKPNEIIHIMQEKNSFQWELVLRKKTRLNDLNPQEISYFIKEIELSPNVSSYIKDKSTEEILEHFQLINNRYATNLGILWLGYPKQRARLNYPLTVQYLVYNSKEEKIRKIDWNFCKYNPKALILEIEKEAVELFTFDEFEEGFFRRKIYHFPKEVIREILVNAFAHRSYSISGDIYISRFIDRLKVTNPGGLPLGITPQNILHKSHCRNTHLINIMKVMGLMESEGSGYDMIYEKLCLNNKKLPEISSEYDAFTVKIFSDVISKETAEAMSQVVYHYQQLRQKDIITLGVIAQEQKISALHLTSKLQLEKDERLRAWVSRLLEIGLIKKRGSKRATEYLLNQDFFNKIGKDIKTTLKTVEPHVLRDLILEDLKRHPLSTIRNIQERLKDLSINEIRKILINLREEGLIEQSGGRKFRKYSLA